MLADADLLRYYFAELAALREEGPGFAERHPRIAGALELASTVEQDPQVARLIESFAFLTARVRQSFDADFPLIPAALLEQLYPQLAAPLPAVGIAAFETLPEQYVLTQNVEVPRDTTLFARLETGGECRFRTTSAFTLWPLEASKISFLDPDTLRIKDATGKAGLRVTLRCAGMLNFRKVRTGTLRFFLDGDGTSPFALYDLLGRHCTSIAASIGTVEHRILPKLRLTASGFTPAEAALPISAAGHHAYRLLQEYFACPAKFLFFDLEGFDPADFDDADAVTLTFLLDQAPSAALRNANVRLRLNCVPIINLFPRTSEPIRLDHQRSDYLIQCDARDPMGIEVHSVRTVTRTAAVDGASAVPPYFRIGDTAPGSLRWIARRRPALGGAGEGTETVLAFVDPALDPQVPAETVLFAQTLCTNRRRTRALGPGARLEIESALPTGPITLASSLSIPQDPPMRGAQLWPLVSQLSLNKLSFTYGAESLRGLRQILILHAAGETQIAAHRQLNGLIGLATRPIAARLPLPAWRPMVRGTEVTLTFNSAAFALHSALLFSAVLDRFFALHASMNSFTRLVLRRDQEKEVWHQWPNRAGDEPLL